MKTRWTKFFIKYFDFNSNTKVDWWEVVLPLLAFSILDIILGIISNLIFDIF